MRRLLLAAAAGALLTGLAVRAQPVVFSGTLAGINDRGAIRLGVRDSALPFAFPNRAGEAVGFAVDLCMGVAADVAAAMNRPLLEPGAPPGGSGLRVEIVTVSAEQRLPKVVAGEIDLECGSTTATEERARSVAFSPVFFLAGTRLLVRAEGGVAGFRDLGGRTVAAAAGTTNNAVLRALAGRVTPPITVLDAPDLPAAYAALKDGRAAALASDDVLLAGLLAADGERGRFRTVGEFLSFEPYALVFRRDDPEFAALVAASFRRMASADVLRTRYRRWFLDRLPNGETLNLPMSPQLTEMYRALGETD